MEGSSKSSVTTPARSQDGSFTLPKQLEDISPATEFPTVHHRWNTNEEIASILIAFEKHKEWQERELKTRPPSGSMLLYSRNEVRYRKDGYCWKKRRDGKTPREDHMKLKVQGLECINGSYVHSAILPTFHRRCYWLLQNPDIVLVHYLNVPYPDNTKLSIPVVSYAMEKKEWTKEELVDQLQPMFTAGSQNEECRHMIEETVEAIVQQLIDFQDKRKTKPHVCDATCDKNCLHSNCFKISPRGEISTLHCQSPTTSIHNRLISFLQHNNQKITTRTTVPQETKTQSVVLSAASTESVNAANIAQQPFILSLGNIPNNGLILVSGQTTTPVSILSRSVATLQPPNVINSHVTNLQQSHIVGSTVGTAVPTQFGQQPGQILAVPSAHHIATQIPAQPQHYAQVQSSNKASTSNGKKEQCNLLVGLNNQIVSLQMSSEGNLEIVNVTNKNEQSTNATALTNMNVKLETDVLGSNTDTMDSFQGSMTSLTGSDLNLDHLDLLDLPDLDKLCNDVGVIDEESNNLVSCDTAGNGALLDCVTSIHPQTRTAKGPASTIVLPQSQTLSSQDEQLKVTITDFSPDWSYTEGGTKVLIVGPWYSNCSSYSCLFDGKRVPATFVQSGVLRCFTPAHDIGLVSLQIINDEYVISNSVVFEFKDRERLDSQLGQQDWFSLDENQLRTLLVERIEQLEKQINSVCGDTSSLKQIPVCDFEDKVESYMEDVISQLWSNADTFPKTGTLALTLLHLAAGLGYSKLIHTLIQQRSNNSNWLLEYEVDAHSVDQNSCTPLMWACAKGKRVAAMTLYHWNKGPLKVCNKEGFLPLYIAHKKGYHGLANDIDQLEQSEMDTSVFDSKHSFVHANSNATFSVAPSKSSNIPITSTPISKNSLFQTPQLMNTSKPVLGNLHIDIPPPPYTSNSRLVRRRSDQMIRETGTRGQLNKRFSVDVLPRSGSNSPQFLPGRPYQKPVREANSEPRLSVSAHTHSVTGEENPMFSGRDLPDMDMQTESFLDSYKLSSDNIVPIEPYPATQDPNSMLVHMDTDEILSVRIDSPFIDVEKLSPNEAVLECGKCKKGGDGQSASSEGSEDAKHQMVTLAKQIIAAMPERIKSSPGRADDIPADEIIRERSSSHSSLQSQLSPHASSYGEDSGISTPMGDSWDFDEYRYTDIGTPASSMSPDSTCLTSPYSPYNFQLDSPPPTTADFTEYFNAPATFMEKDFSQLTLSDQEQRRLYEAAKVIQHAYRHYRDKQQQKEIEAAILIQSYYRRYKQYAYYKKMTQAAVLIQSQFRSYYAQKRFKKSRDAAVVIQNQYRSYREHERLKKSGNKSVIIQQRFRSHYQRKLADAAEDEQVVQLVSEKGDRSTVDSNTTQAGPNKDPEAESGTLPPNQENVVKGETTEDHKSSNKSVKEQL